MQDNLTASERYEAAQKRPSKGYTIRFSNADMKMIHSASRPADFNKKGELVVARVIKRMAGLPSAMMQNPD